MLFNKRLNEIEKDKDEEKNKNKANVASGFLKNSLFMLYSKCFHFTVVVAAMAIRHEWKKMRSTEKRMK